MAHFSHKKTKNKSIINFLLSITSAFFALFIFSSCSNKNETTAQELHISGAEQLCVNEETKLEAFLSPSIKNDAEFIWVSNNNSIATVNNSGIVSGISKGEVTISASFQKENGSFLIAYHKMNIIAPRANEVILNETNLELNFNEAIQLQATVFPVNSNQQVSWKTNNEEIVSVTNNGLVQAKDKIGKATITATTIDGERTAQCDVNVIDFYKKTIFIYICGSDLESGQSSSLLNPKINGYASLDLQEMISVENKPDDIKIIVETGGAKKWAMQEISSNEIQRWEIEPHNLTLKETVSQSNMGSPYTLQRFLEWGFKKYTSEEYGLILWDHGNGLDGVCEDENFDYDCLTHEEIYEAVKRARTNSNIKKKLNWIAYDACKMQVQDIADYNSLNFDYMLASQSNEPALGYDYNSWLNFLYQNPSIDSETLLEKIGNSYILSSEEYSETMHKKHIYSQSVINLSIFSSYKNVFETFCSSLNLLLENNANNVETIKNLIKNSKRHGTNLYDIEDVLNKIKESETFSSFENEIEIIKQKLNEAIIYEEHGIDTSGCGLSLFCPIDDYSLEYFPYNNSGYETFFTNWSETVHKIFSSISSQ